VSLVPLVTNPTLPAQTVWPVLLVSTPLMVWLVNLVPPVAFPRPLLLLNVLSASVVLRLILVALLVVLVTLVSSRIMMVLVKPVLTDNTVPLRDLATATSVLLVMRRLLIALVALPARLVSILLMVLPVNHANLVRSLRIRLPLSVLLVLWAMVTLLIPLCVDLVLLVPLPILERLVHLASLVRCPMSVALACLVLLAKVTLVPLILATLVPRDLVPWREVFASVVLREASRDRVVSVCLVLLVTSPTLVKPLVLNVLKVPSPRTANLVSLVLSASSPLVPVPSNVLSAALEALPMLLVLPVSFARLVSAL